MEIIMKFYIDSWMDEDMDVMQEGPDRLVI